MNYRKIAADLQREFRGRIAVAYIPAEDESVDDAIEVSVDGQPTLELQIGPNYFAVNRYIYEDGELDCVEHYHSCNNLGEAFIVLRQAMQGVTR